MTTENTTPETQGGVDVDPLKPLWTLEAALVFARLFERIIEGVGYHCALGGGVLHNGESSKDLDIFVYPHYKQSAGDSFEPVLKALQAMPIIVNQVSFYKDNKIVFMGDWNGKRIDFFFVS